MKQTRAYRATPSRVPPDARPVELLITRDNLCRLDSHLGPLGLGIGEKLGVGKEDIRRVRQVLADRGIAADLVAWLHDERGGRAGFGLRPVILEDEQRLGIRSRTRVLGDVPAAPPPPIPVRPGTEVRAPRPEAPPARKTPTGPSAEWLKRTGVHLHYHRGNAPTD